MSHAASSRPGGVKAEPVAVVSGGSSGIGAAIAKRLQHEGYRVVILGRRRERFDEATRSGMLAYACDVSNIEQIQRAAKDLVAATSGIDVLVNCAGIIRMSSVCNINSFDLERQLQVNIGGVINCTRVFYDYLKERKGSIINISSALASRPLPDCSVYAATKGAVESFTRASALELARFGIRVNAVAPGLVRSEIYLSDNLSEIDYKVLLQEFSEKYLLGRHGEPNDIADIVAFLASTNASWITGVVVPVDSGYSNCGFRS